MSIARGIRYCNMVGPDPDNDDVDDSTNPGSADPWSDYNDGNGTDTDGGIW